MLKNEKVLSNNGKIIKGIHLESFIYFDNDTYVSLTYSTSGATTQNPLTVYIYDSNSYALDINTSDVTDRNLIVSDGQSTDKYIMTYGNNDALTKVSFNYDFINGDLKGFINNYSKLKELTVYRSNVNQNFDYFEWPTSLTKLELTYGSNMVGDTGTWTGIENINYLNLSAMGFTGEISNFVGLTYLQYAYFYNNYNLTGSVNDWTFQPNLTWIQIPYNYLLSGDVTNWTFPNNLEYLYLYQNKALTGNISNWDFSNCSSNINTINIDSYQQSSPFTGNLTGWTFYDNIEINSFSISRTNITHLPLDFTNISIGSTFTVQYNGSLISNIQDLQVPGNMNNFNIIGNQNMGGNINLFNFPNNVINFQCFNNAWVGDFFAVDIDSISGVTNFILYGNNLTGDVSGMTLWEGLETLNLHDNNITGTLSPQTFPTSLDDLQLYNNNIVLDLSSTFNFGNITSFLFHNISGVTGDFSNLILNSPRYFYFNDNTFNINIGNFSMSNWDNLDYFNLQNTSTNGNSDITSFFPSGSTGPDLSNLSIYSTDITGDITNWIFDAFSYTYSNINLSLSNLYGDISNWNCPLARSVNIQSTSITGDIGLLDLTTHPTLTLSAENSALYGNLSGVTLHYTFNQIYLTNVTGVTGVDDFMEYLWVNRKNWTYNFTVRLSGLTETPSGTYELGDLGTYGGLPGDLTEAEINNLVLGNDYDGGGSNTPWNQLQKYYYQKEYKVAQGYKINTIVYNGS